MHMKVSYHKTSFSRATRDITPPRVSTDSLFSFSAAKIDSESQRGSADKQFQFREERKRQQDFFTAAFPNPSLVRSVNERKTEKRPESKLRTTSFIKTGTVRSCQLDYIQ